MATQICVVLYNPLKHTNLKTLNYNELDSSG